MTIYIFVIIYITCVSYAMWTDVASMTIPNWISVTLTLSFGLFAILNLQLVPAAIHISIAVIVFAVTFGCYVMHWMGGGDVKLLSALSAWMGPEHIMPFLFNVALLGGLLALIVIILRSAAGASIFASRYPDMREWIERATSRHIPYAVPIGLAAMISGSALFPAIAATIAT